MSRIKIASHSFLVQNFHEFFNLILRQKEYALRVNEGRDPTILENEAEEAMKTSEEALESAPEETETPPEISAEEETQPPQQTPQPKTPTSLQTSLEEEKETALVNTIQRRLSVLLEEQAIQATVQAGEFTSGSYQDALYAMVAYADEVFLNIHWGGQKQWENNLLESRFFQTQIAGELIFEKIDELLLLNDPMRSDLAIVYLLILGLGFKGRYRNGENNPKELVRYRQQLYVMINRHPSTLFQPGRPHLIEDCYEHVLDSTISKGLPEIRMWMYTFLGILGVYVFASTVLWYSVVKEMDTSIANLLQQTQKMGMS